MTESRKTLVIVVAAVAAVLAIYSGWRAFGGSGVSPDAARKTNMGPISARSSIMGPDASGRPRTEMSDGGPAGAQAPGGMTPMQRMRGPSAGQQ
jgi:hypothetical protein